jgi:hypothetical protein
MQRSSKVFVEKSVHAVAWPVTGEKEFRILACGDRNWVLIKPIEQWVTDGFNYCNLMKYQPRLIHGAAAGADEIAGFVGEHIGMQVDPHPAEWATYGRKAGPIRNRAMLHQNPHVVLAFHNNLAASKGTSDMVQIALVARRPVYRIAADCRVWELSLV